MSRELRIVTTISLGPPVTTRDHATGTTFSGWTPNRVGQAVATELMRQIGVGERIHDYRVELAPPAARDARP